jgi:hypothetical protein
LPGGVDQIFFDISGSEISNLAKAKAFIDGLYSSGSAKIVGESILLGE